MFCPSHDLTLLSQDNIAEKILVQHSVGTMEGGGAAAGWVCSVE